MNHLDSIKYWEQQLQRVDAEMRTWLDLQQQREEILNQILLLELELAQAVAHEHPVS